jgi:hypothetical protein
MSKPKEWQEAMLKKENQIIRDTQLYCANNDIEFHKKHNILMRNAMRQFFKEGVYPIIREIFDSPDKKYTDK